MGKLKPWFEEGMVLGDWTLGPELTTPEGVLLQHVRVAEHAGGRRGVVKIVRGGRGGARVRLENEIKAMQRLAGTPGVLSILDSSTEANAYVVMPPVQTLREHLGPQPNLREVVGAIADLADTLAVLHRQPTHHRDLKPENLFWDGHRALLGDFGLVLDSHAAQGGVMVEGAMVGSIYFMAPEARSVASDIDWGPADVYSLAIFLVELDPLDHGLLNAQHTSPQADIPHAVLLITGSCAFDGSETYAENGVRLLQTRSGAHRCVRRAVFVGLYL